MAKTINAQRNNQFEIVLFCVMTKVIGLKERFVQIKGDKRIGSKGAMPPSNYPLTFLCF
jgi:hypothetical protein